MGTILSAIMASSCCWAPPLLIIMGFSGAGMVAALETYRIPFMVLTFGFLGFAFYLTYRPKAATEDCCAPKAGGRFNMMTLNKIMLWGVTAMAVVFLFFPQMITSMIADSGELTDDMVKVVVHVEGMTCPG